MERTSSSLCRKGRSNSAIRAVVSPMVRIESSYGSVCAWGAAVEEEGACPPGVCEGDWLSVGRVLDWGHLLLVKPRERGVRSEGL